jgi:hypothetical protein
MKRKRSLTLTQSRCNTSSTTRLEQSSHKVCPLLQLPCELRFRILQNLLYSSKPLGKKSDDNPKRIYGRRFRKNFKFYPAILAVCRQVYAEGYEILYRQNTATATMMLWDDDECSSVTCLKDLIPLHGLGVVICQRFTNWDVTVKLNIIKIPKDATDTIIRFTSDILREIPNLNKVKVRLELWKYRDLYDPESHVTFADPRDFGDIAEQIFRPFSTIRVRQAEFIDKLGYPIRTTLPLSRLMMSESPPPMTLHRLFNDLSLFIDGSLSGQSRRVVKARLVPLQIACDQYDVDAFCFTLRSLLAYLSCVRDLVPPHHLVEFAQGSLCATTNMGRIT